MFRPNRCHKAKVERVSAKTGRLCLYVSPKAKTPLFIMLLSLHFCSLRTNVLHNTCWFEILDYYDLLIDFPKEKFFMKPKDTTYDPEKCQSFGF